MTLVLSTPQLLSSHMQEQNTISGLECSLVELFRENGNSSFAYVLVAYKKPTYSSEGEEDQLYHTQHHLLQWSRNRGARGKLPPPPQYLWWEGNAPPPLQCTPNELVLYIVHMLYCTCNTSKMNTATYIYYLATCNFFCGHGPISIIFW